MQDVSTQDDIEARIPEWQAGGIPTGKPSSGWTACSPADLGARKIHAHRDRWRGLQQLEVGTLAAADFQQTVLGFYRNTLKEFPLSSGQVRVPRLPQELGLIRTREVLSLESFKPPDLIRSGLPVSI